MKKNFICLGVAIGAFLLSGNANAKSWRINSNPNAMPHFTSINDAVANMDVSNGDTLYIEPCSTIGKTLIDKRLVLIGPGYNLNRNGFNFARMGEAYINEISFSDNVANNSQLIGLCIGRVNCGIIKVEIKNCKIRNGYFTGKVTGCYFYEGGGNEAIELTSNTSFENNLVINVTASYDVLKAASGCVIKNNVLIGISTSAFQQEKSCVVSGSYCTILNNIVISKTEGYNMVGDVTRPYTNNTIKFDATNDIRNNILSTTEEWKNLGFPDNFYIGADEAMCFKMEGSDDAKYQLKENSPAINSALGGGDCGAFGGLYPYSLSGVTGGTPYIYDAIISDRPVDGKVSVKFKARVHNEE